VGSDVLERVRQAYETATAGDVSELVALFDPDTVWRGVERGRLWWRNAPS
jgi:ketosteroid isomerase-like protein